MARPKSEILQIVMNQLSNAERFMTSLNGDRSEAIDYYLGKRPYPIPNRTRHTSLDVMDGVEGTRSLFMEMLLSGEGAVKFRDELQPGSSRELMARAYVNDQFLNKNPGSALLSDFLFDASMYKLGVIHACWKKDRVTCTKTFSDMTEEELTLLGQDPKIRFDSFSSRRDRDTGIQLWQGQYSYERDVSQVKLRNVRPDHFYLPEMCGDVLRPPFLAERIGAMEGDLLDEGISKRVIEELPEYVQDDSLNIARLNSGYTDDYEPLRSGRSRREIYQAYILADFERKGDLQLYEVRFHQNVLIDYTPVDSHGYFWWSPIRISHKTIGLSYADVMRGVQAHQTALRRGIIDTAIANTNRVRYANMNMFADPSRLLNERWNEVHEVMDVNNCVREADAPQVSEVTMTLMQVLEQEKETRLGLTRAASGMNADVLSHQNSRELINDYTRAGMRRPAQQARVLIDTCLGPLFKEILSLGAQHDKNSYVYQINKMDTTVDPAMLDPDTLAFSAQLALSPQEKQEESDRLLGLDRMLSDPQGGIGPLYGEQNRYALFQRVLELSGATGYQAFITNPADPAYQQQQAASAQQAKEQAEREQQLREAQAQAQMVLAQAEMLKAQVAQMKADSDRQIEALKLKLEQTKAAAEMENDDEKLDIERQKLKKVM